MTERQVWVVLGASTVLLAAVLAVLWRPAPPKLEVHVPVAQTSEPAAPGPGSARPRPIREPRPERAPTVESADDPGPDEPEAEPTISIRCSIRWPSGFDPSQERLWVSWGQGGAPASTTADSVSFDVPPEVQSAELRLSANPIATLVFRDGSCLVTDPEIPERILTGTLRGTSELDRRIARVTACGDPVYNFTPSPDGLTFRIRTDAERCQVQVHRIAGDLALPGEPVYAEPTVEGTDVTLDFPDYEPAGMGVTFEMGELGARVMGVLPGSPAEEAGLRKGDRIVAIDGEDVRGMTTDEFLTWGLGPEGSEIELVLEGPEGERSIRFERAFIERTR